MDYGYVLMRTPFVDSSILRSKAQRDMYIKYAHIYKTDPSMKRTKYANASNVFIQANARPRDPRARVSR